MTPRTTEQILEVGGPLSRRTTVIANVRWFRRLAWRALRDGAPSGQARAANARAAARILIRQARREALVDRMIRDAQTADL
ncbi:hypothetical protein AFCDBAGC_3012 [Methylobacterium cerastii]|uniref:Uncharacterized protein n=1 Tax=Methylobacterium cerastii TaxID=932741 RepID=A0ABQ4QIR9_9HYPH|nr:MULTISPECIES: hypothetical protein [Methylobacterium]TXN83097.1 hypothetical protein FV234_07830 [Methylobacterium sp. WL8]GJD45143.1 hypothetical protein AFCDBAGC_3012 [Methylobacterium cerastii]